MEMCRKQLGGRKSIIRAGKKVEMKPSDRARVCEKTSNKDIHESENLSTEQGWPSG